jgi:hypothetical protein
LNSFIRYLSSAFPPKKFCATHWRHTYVYRYLCILKILWYTM